MGFIVIHNRLVNSETKGAIREEERIFIRLYYVRFFLNRFCRIHGVTISPRTPKTEGAVGRRTPRGTDNVLNESTVAKSVFGNTEHVREISSK